MMCCQVKVLAYFSFLLLSLSLGNNTCSSPSVFPVITSHFPSGFILPLFWASHSQLTALLHISVRKIDVNGNFHNPHQGSCPPSSVCCCTPRLPSLEVEGTGFPLLPGSSPLPTQGLCSSKSLFSSPSHHVFRLFPVDHSHQHTNDSYFFSHLYK